MKKQYTKKQIQEAISYWKKQLKTINESGSNGNDPLQCIANETKTKVEQVLRAMASLAEEYLSEGQRCYKVWYHSRIPSVEFMFRADVEGYVDNDGIGAYEYWGSSGYDAGTDYLEITNGGLSEDELNAVAEKMAELMNSDGRIDLVDVNDDVDIEEKVQYGSISIEIDIERVLSNMPAIAKELSQRFGKTQKCEIDID
jgi:hypothetical protein